MEGMKRTAARLVFVFAAALALAAAAPAQTTYDWDFGDGSAHSNLQNPGHIYSRGGTYTWSVTVAQGGVSCTKTGSVKVEDGLPSTMVFAVSPSQPASTQALAIPAAAGQAWQISGDYVWLSFGTTSGTGPATVNLTATSGGYSAGDYSGFVKVTINGVVSWIRVTLKVSADVTVSPVVSVSPTNGAPGTTFTYQGSGFTPNSTATLNVVRADGTTLREYARVKGVTDLVTGRRETTDGGGRFLYYHSSQPGDPLGAWSFQATDDSSGKLSNAARLTLTDPDAANPATDVMTFTGSTVDVTVPDNTELAPGQAFQKIWKIKNAGSNSWSGYTLVALTGTVAGNTSQNLAAVSQVALPATSSGQVINTPAISMAAPAAAGTYYSYWRLRTAGGADVGDALYAKIKVVEQQPVSAGMGAVGGSSDGRQGGSSTDSESTPSGWASDPVNTALGNYTFQRTDLSVPGRGADFRFGRTYNSNDASLGPLGYGWSHNFAISLENIAATTLSLHYSDGKVMEFEDRYGVWQPRAAGYHDMLVKNADGSWTLLKQDQRRYQFTAAGRLSAVQDSNGNQTSLGYDGAGNMTQATDAAGRIYQFTYQGSLLTVVTDPLGRTLQFTYDAGSNLATSRDLNGNSTAYSYDVGHRLTRVVDPRGNNLLVNTYDGAGRVATQTNGRGYQWQFSYDDAGRTTTVTDPYGSQEKHLHDTNFFLQRIVDPLNQAVNVLYDQQKNPSQVSDGKGNFYNLQADSYGNLTRSTDPYQNSTQISYDGRNNPTQVIDPLGNTTQMSYDDKGNLTGLSDAGSAPTSITYNGNGQPLTITNANGAVTTCAYDSSGNLASVKDALNNTAAFAYDAVGRRTRATDRRGKATDFTYDANNNLLTVTDPLGQVTRFTYDANNNLLSRQDPRSNTTLYEYDENNLLAKAVDPLGNYVQYGYDRLDRRVSARDRRGNVTGFEYDAAGRLTAVVDALGGRTTFTYDANGNRLTSADPLSHVTGYSYDALNRLTATARDAAGLKLTTRWGYDAGGRLTSTQDAKGQTTQFGYDGVGRLTRVTDALGGVVSMGYDAVGNRTSGTDALANGTLYAYDLSNRLTRKTEALGGEYQYGYDAAGNMVSREDARGNTTAYEYDDLNRLTRVVYPGGTPTAFVYDAAGNRTGMTDGLGSSSFTYDGANRLLSSTDPFGKTVGYCYDAHGNRTSTTYPDGKVVQYTYDALNRLSTVTDWLSQTSVYSYDAAGRLTRLTYANGTTCDYSYDAADRMTWLVNGRGDGSVISSYAYALDALGNHLSTDRQEPLSPLTPAQVVSYSFDAENRLTAAGGLSYTYDANGNLTGRGADTFAYDFEDLLTQGVLGGTTTQYRYDGLGNRYARSSVGQATRYVVDRNKALPDAIQETDGTGAVQRYYVYGLGLLAQMDATGGNTRYYHFDGAGSTVALTDGGQNITDTYAYDPFGKLQERSGSTANPFLYVGKFGVQQEQSGPLYMRARYYLPEAGRFICKDRIGGPADTLLPMNRYSYADNNPLTRIDPSGLEDIQCYSRFDRTCNELASSDGKESFLHSLKSSSAPGASGGASTFEINRKLEDKLPRHQIADVIYNTDVAPVVSCGIGVKLGPVNFSVDLFSLEWNGNGLGASGPSLNASVGKSIGVGTEVTNSKPNASLSLSMGFCSIGLNFEYDKKPETETAADVKPPSVSLSPEKNPK